MEEKKWLDLLLYTDRLNRSVKEAGWNYADKEKVYGLKDSVVQTLLRAKPDGVNFELYYVPYFKYSGATKDRAGALMRQDGNKYPFEYYLSQVEPSEYDYEVPEKALRSDSGVPRSGVQLPHAARQNNRVRICNILS